MPRSFLEPHPLFRHRTHHEPLFGLGCSCYTRNPAYPTRNATGLYSLCQPFCCALPGKRCARCARTSTTHVCPELRHQSRTPYIHFRRERSKSTCPPFCPYSSSSRRNQRQYARARVGHCTFCPGLSGCRYPYATSPSMPAVSLPLRLYVQRSVPVPR